MSESTVAWIILTTHLMQPPFFQTWADQQPYLRNSSANVFDVYCATPRSLSGISIDSTAALKIMFQQRSADFFFKIAFLEHIDNVNASKSFTLVVSDDFSWFKVRQALGSAHIRFSKPCKTLFPWFSNSVRCSSKNDTFNGPSLRGIDVSGTYENSVKTPLLFTASAVP